MGFDPFLYAALAGGFVVGRLSPVHPGWIDRASAGVVLVLVGALGALIAQLPWSTVETELPLAVGFASLVLLLSASLARLLAHRPKARARVAFRWPWFGVAVAAAVVVGFAV